MASLFSCLAKSPRLEASEARCIELQQQLTSTEAALRAAEQRADSTAAQLAATAAEKAAADVATRWQRAQIDLDAERERLAAELRATQVGGC